MGNNNSKKLGYSMYNREMLENDAPSGSVPAAANDPTNGAGGYYDPNLGSTVVEKPQKLTSEENKFPTAPASTVPFAPVKTSGFTCSEDIDCQNPSSFASDPSKGLVLSCPSAKCVGQKCECGSDCQLDPYSQVCCQSLEVINGESYCVEHKDKIPPPPPAFGKDPIFYFNKKR